MIAIQSKFLQVAVEIFNLNNIIGDEYLNRKLVPYSPSLAYLSKDSSKWGQLINWLILYKIETLTYVGMLDNLRVLAGRQIKFLKNEYRLK